MIGKEMRQLTLAALLLGSLFWLSACAVGTSKHNEQRPTLGQELSDLKTARDNGAISEEEYAAAKAALLKRDQ